MKAQPPSFPLKRHQVIDGQGGVKRSLGGRREARHHRTAAVRLKTILSVISVDQSSGLCTHTHRQQFTCQTQSQWLSPYPRQGLRTPCTAPGCSMGHLLKRTRTKHNVLSLERIESRRKNTQKEQGGIKGRTGEAL